MAEITESGKFARIAQLAVLAERMKQLERFKIATFGELAKNIY